MNLVPACAMLKYTTDWCAIYDKDEFIPHIYMQMTSRKLQEKKKKKEEEEEIKVKKENGSAEILQY